MTNDELQDIMKSPNGISSADFDRIWADMKALDARREAALTPYQTRIKNASKKSFPTRL